MKKIIYIAVVLIANSITSCSNKTTSDSNTETTMMASNAQSTFKVWGNCEMCKETIEASLKVDGIAKADWNVDTKIMSVSFDSTKINLDKIQKNIAMVGYDNEKYTGDMKAYGNLPECCQYDRK